MQIISDLLDYVNDGRVAQSLAASQDSIGPADLRIVAIKVLAWLKSQNRLRTKRPLKMNMQHSWCENLAALLAMNTEMAGIFVISEGEFDFRAGIADDTRAEILAHVDARYQPPLMTLARVVDQRVFTTGAKESRTPRNNDKSTTLSTSTRRLP